MTAAHRCRRFRQDRREGPWRDEGPLRERQIERVSVCSECGSERAARFRRIVAVEREGRRPGGGALAEPSLRRLARRLDVLFQHRTLVRAAPLARRLGGVRLEPDLERLAACGSVRLVYRPVAGSLHLDAVRLLEPGALAEVARPGAAARRAVALAEARRQTAVVVHPEAKRLADLLAGEEAAAMDERVIRSIAGLVRLLEEGEPRPARVFATQVLGHSKALAPIRPRLERLVGPLERLGIRDSGTLVLMGGAGRLRLASADIEVEKFRYVGLASHDVLALRQVDLPAGGLVVIENLTPFEAYVDRLATRRSALVLWCAGFPGRAAIRVIQQAAAAKAPIRAWCDVDLGGVRIARLICQAAAGTAQPLLMDPATVRGASLVRPLSPEQRGAIKRDLGLHPDAMLADTLRAILERSAWMEQESLLDRLGGSHFA